MINLDKAIETVRRYKGPSCSGKVTKITGTLIESSQLKICLGQLCEVFGYQSSLLCEVVGFKENRVLLMPLGPIHDIYPGAEVFCCDQSNQVKVGTGCLGRVLNALGNPIDDKGRMETQEKREIKAAAPDPLKRKSIDEIFCTQIKAIDGLITLGKGQRLGIFAGSGVGKSMLMTKLSKAEADVNVIALIGERGREVKDFIHKHLGSALSKSVVIVATSDQAPLLRYRGALLATTIAEFFRDQGCNVLFMMDSVTRFAFALREIGLAIGEPLTSKGYTPSVFSAFAQLVERAGYSEKGSITGIYTVLAESDDLEDPLIDQMRSLLDGHLVLSRKLSNQGHYPPIDILQSLSRVMPDLVSAKHRKKAAYFKELYHNYFEALELIQVGAYVEGSDPKIEEAKQKIRALESFLKQDVDESFTYHQTATLLDEIL